MIKYNIKKRKMKKKRKNEGNNLWSWKLKTMDLSLEELVAKIIDPTFL